MIDHKFTMNDPLHQEGISFLEKIGTMDDGKIDLLKTALILASLSEEEPISLSFYEEHIQQMIDALAKLSAETLEDKVSALNKVLFDQNGYHGNHEDYDDLENANMLRVIDRRKGLPVALGILYIHLARSQGWTVYGLSFPGHFIVRFEQGGQRLIVDPFNEGRTLEAFDLRQFVKVAIGSDAELSSSFYNVLSNREILLRLQNNIKVRLIREEEYEKSVQVVEVMRLLDPNENRLLFDAGLLYSRTGQIKHSLELLAEYRESGLPYQERSEVSAIMREIEVLMT